MEELAGTLARQVTLNVAPLYCAPTHQMKNAFRRSSSPKGHESRISTRCVMTNKAILSPVQAKRCRVRDRLALDGKKAGGYFNQQIAQSIAGKNGPLGYLRLTLDTHTLATEAQQVDNTTQHFTPDVAAFTGNWRSADPHAATG
ncbi:AhpA/YtjB family protein [Escherichia coli]